MGNQCWQLLTNLMIVYIICFILTINGAIQLNTAIPFFVMKPNTIINQTLHSYCQEQSQFNIQTMFIDLTEWPSGFIYSSNPYEKLDHNVGYEECTMELRASMKGHIRLVVSSINIGIPDTYDDDYFQSLSEFPCLRIRDNNETIIYDCLRRSFEINGNESREYLSLTNVIFLELIQPSDDIRFEFFFTSLHQKSLSTCFDQSWFDCGDLYCVHPTGRCNRLDECRTKLDEISCESLQSNADQSHSFQSIIYSMSLFIYVLTHGQSLS